MKNNYGQQAEKCIFYNIKCRSPHYNGICYISKGQFCRIYDYMFNQKKEVENEKDNN